MTLDELEKLLAKATPGPWDAHDYAEGGAGDRRYQIQERAGARRRDKTGSVLGYFEDEQIPSPEARANARLVATMRNEFPKFIAKQRAAEKLAEAAEEMVLQAYDDYDKCQVCQGKSGGGVGHESNCAVVWLGKELDAFLKAGEP